MDTSVWRDQKTVVWFDEVPATAGRWNRWDIGATDTTVATALHAMGLTPDVVVCLNDPEVVRGWLEAGNWSKSRLVVVPKALVNALGMDKLLEMKVNNLLCIDEVHDLYPFTGGAWDGSKEDAKVLITLALHYGRTFPVVASEARAAVAAHRGLRLSATVEEPKPLWFVTQYYRPDKAVRRDEIDTCLQKNLECGLIDRVVLLNEKVMGSPKSEKILEKVVGERLTYARVIRWIQEEAPEDAIVVFANADIFLDEESWRVLWSTDLDTTAKFLALLRWDVTDTSAAALKAAKLFGPRPDSQDTWVVSAKAVKAVQWDWDALKFPFGQGGCDNAITLEMFKKRFLIANPALTLRTYHYHSSAVRTYDPRNIVDKPTYLYVQPTGLHDMRPVTTLASASKGAKELKAESFARPVRGPLSAAQAKTFCTMVGRSTDNAIVLTDDSDNMWIPPALSLYPLEEVFQTREGLAYTYDSILVGNTKASTNAWADSQLSSMSASLTVETAAVAPLRDATAKDPAKFILEYMSKIFLLREQEGYSGAEFWCPKNRGCIEAVKMFNWPNREVPVLSRDDNLQTWCKKAIMWGYEDTPVEYIRREEVMALRKNLGLGGWKPEVTSDKPRIVIVVDEAWFTEEMAEEIEGALGDNVHVKLIWPGKTALDVCLQSVLGSTGLIVASHTMASWAWAMPKGSYIWEIQSEMKPNASLLHLAAAAEVEHRLLIVAKGVPNAREKDSMRAKLVADVRSKLLISPPSVLILPQEQEGFFGHAGDSFREMAELWGKRGYVEVVKRPVSQVWLGGVGETLLYDRPTLQWLDAAPPGEKAWKRALFGNPAPPSGAQPWSFWPRRPELVEQLVAEGLPAKSFEAREKTLVFYGRSENAVQRKRRTGADWASACDDFAHEIAVTDKYKYTHAEYLSRLASAKYGLCLAGFGNKCHREIECMAMGCVPVVAPEVDMTNYAEPPEEGLHYFRVSTPEEAKAVTATTAERWTVMSAACRDWWKRNASAEGMWELTKKMASR